MPFGPHIPQMYRQLSQRRRLGSFYLAIDPGRFAGGKSLPRVARVMGEEARAQPRARAKNPVLVPGDPELSTAEKREKDGIPIEPGLRIEMARWSKRLSVEVPWERKDV